VTSPRVRREGVEWRNAAADQLLVDRDRLADRGQQAVGEREVLAREAGEVADAGDPAALRGRQAGRDGVQRLLGLLQSQDVDRLAEERDRELPAIGQDLLVVARDVADLGREQQIRLGEQRADPVVDHLGLERIVVVDDHVDGRGLRAAGAQLRLQLADEVGGQDQAAEDVAVLHLLLDLGAARDVHALDLGAELAAGLLLAEAPGTEAEAMPGRDLVEERDPGLLRAAGDRQADQDGEHDRVDDQQPGDQGRAAQQLQVLEQQPAHQWPMPRRKRTKSFSGSATEPFGRGPAARRIWAKVPSKIVSPSARTTSRSP